MQQQSVNTFGFQPTITKKNTCRVQFKVGHTLDACFSSRIDLCRTHTHTHPHITTSRHRIVFASSAHTRFYVLVFVSGIFVVPKHMYDKCFSVVLRAGIAMFCKLNLIVEMFLKEKMSIHLNVVEEFTTIFDFAIWNFFNTNYWKLKQLLLIHV